MHRPRRAWKLDHAGPEELNAKEKLVQNGTREAGCGQVTQSLRVPVICTLVFTLSARKPPMGFKLGNDDTVVYFHLN